tara:strand:- start:603 stop:812 length:210 start_codon:yes stop_codon:yes gene_type:complete
MVIKARRVPNVRTEIVDDWYGSIVDKEWDEYEVGSSFLVEEPYSPPKPSLPKLGTDSEVYWTVNFKEIQ